MGHRPIHFEVVDMAALVQQCLQTLAHQLRERQVCVIVGALPQVHADSMAMSQIVSNLLSNAINALMPGRPGELRITAAAGPETTAFHIQDNGRGIAAEDVPKAFEMFRHLGPQEAAGEGMGLTYVRALVRRHGGDVWCQSTAGAGTTFTFTIAQHPVESHPQHVAGTARRRHFINTRPVPAASRHSRESGNPGNERHGDWMPACAGMTFYWRRTYETDIYTAFHHSS
jgi:signal transduction histidine kinase